MTLCLDLHSVAKTYRGKVHALRGIDMQVERRSVFGLLGPNGAGKSTLVKILMTVIRASAAKGTVLGFPVGDKAALRHVGYLPEHNRFPEYLTGAQVLDFFGAMAVVPRAERKKRSAELLELVGMKDWANKPVRTYSKGMRQRMGIAQALMNDPDLVVLDEPTDGVDPVGRRDIRNVLLHLKDRGKTVFLNSHILSELEMVCDRVAILVQGRVSSQGTLDQLTAHRRCYEIELAAENETVAETIFRGALPPGASLAAPPPPPTAATTPPPTGQLARRVGITGTLATGESLEIDHSLIRVGTSDATVVQPMLDALRARGGIIKAVRPVRPSLEDLFMEAVTDPTTGEAYKPGADRKKPAKRGAN
jgi:ABC-2 type transport system ATP-binding protein